MLLIDEKKATTLQNILLSGLAIGFGFTFYKIIQKAIDQNTGNAGGTDLATTEPTANFTGGEMCEIPSSTAPSGFAYFPVGSSACNKMNDCEHGATHESIGGMGALIRCNQSNESIMVDGNGNVARPRMTTRGSFGRVANPKRKIAESMRNATI